jgi:hypothetical protein
MNYSIRIIGSILLVSSPIWAMQKTDQKLLTLTQLDEHLTKCAKDPVTAKISTYFMKTASTRHIRLYCPSPHAPAAAIIDATLRTLRKYNYPTDTYAETLIDKTFTERSEIPILKLSHTLDNICIAWKMQRVIDASNRTSSIPDEEAGAYYARALKHAQSIVCHNSISYLANGMQKYLTIMMRNK